MRYWLFALLPVALVVGYFVFYFNLDQFGVLWVRSGFPTRIWAIFGPTSIELKGSYIDWLRAALETWHKKSLPELRGWLKRGGASLI